MTIEEFKKLDSQAVTYENITDYIDQVFPEFVQWDDYKSYENDRDLKYVFVAGLVRFAFEHMDKQEDINLAQRLMEFTNTVINKFGKSKNKEKSDDLHNLFGIEVFEDLTGYVKGAHLAREYLTDEALQTFHDVTQHYHTDLFMEEYYKVFGINPIFAKDPEPLYSYMINDLKRPTMNSPEVDELLWDIRTRLEMDEDLIAGILSHLNSKQKPSEALLKSFYGLQKDIRNYREQLISHKASEKNQAYVKDLISFINDLERIYSNTGIWMWSHGIK